MNFFKHLNLFFILFSFPIFISCSSDNSDEMEKTASFKISVESSDLSLGEVYIGNHGTTSTMVAKGQNVTISALPLSNASFEYWTSQTDPSEILSSDQTYTIHNVQQNMAFIANFKEKEEEPAPEVKPGITKGEIVFEDDFNQESRIPDPEKWELCQRLTSNWSRYNSESYNQAYVEDGKLVLLAEIVDGDYKTGAVRMLNDLGFEHCTVEVNARFTKMVAGGWPAIWMMPSVSIYSGWPACGEIDMMEHLNKDGYFYMALHSYYIDTLNKKNPTSSTTKKVDTSEFNTYGLEWNDEEIVFYLNNERVFSYKNLNLANEEEEKQWPFNTDFYIILNHALGGQGTWPGPIDNDELPGIFEVDWVRVSK